MKAFNFVDLTFTANPDHSKNVCAEILSRKLDVKWWCESRANIDLELLDVMREAGCVSVAIGVESGSPRILSEISKGITVEQVVAFCERGRQAWHSCSTLFHVFASRREGGRCEEDAGAHFKA